VTSISVPHRLDGHEEFPARSGRYGTPPAIRKATCLCLAVDCGLQYTVRKARGTVEVLTDVSEAAKHGGQEVFGLGTPVVTAASDKDVG
jgi:hypothetical protein